jgi:hypothetical protein
MSVSGKASTHNCRIWGSENPRFFLEYVRHSPTVNVFCAHCEDCTAPCSIRSRPLPISCVCLYMLQQFLIPQLDGHDQEGRIHFQQDDALPSLAWTSERVNQHPFPWSMDWKRGADSMATLFCGSHTSRFFLMGIPYRPNAHTTFACKCR